MDKAPFIAQMDRKIAIYEITANDSDIGRNGESETLFCEPYAMLTEISGNESVDGKVFHLIDRTYTIRYRREISERGNEMILKDGNETFKITHVKLIGRRSHLVLNCSRNE